MRYVSLVSQIKWQIDGRWTVCYFSYAAFSWCRSTYVQYFSLHC